MNQRFYRGGISFRQVNWWDAGTTHQIVVVTWRIASVSEVIQIVKHDGIT